MPLALSEPRQVECLDRHVERLPVGSLVKNETGGRGIGELVDEVAPADFDRIQTELRRRAIHQPLQGHGDHRARDAAIGRHRTGIGEHAAREAGIGAYVIGAGQLGHRHQRLDRTGRRIAGIGADIGGDIGGKRDDFCIGVERALQSDVLIPAVKRGDQILAAVLGPGDRAPQLARQPNQHDVFGNERHLLTEPAADIGRDDAQFGFGDADQIRNRRPHQVRHLRGTGQRDTPRCGIEGGMAGARLDRRGILAPRTCLDRDLAMRRLLRGGKSRRLDLSLNDEISRGLGVNRRRVIGERRARVDHGRGFGNVHQNVLGHIFGFRFARRHDRGDRFADEPHDAGG